MASLPDSLRRRLENTVVKARDEAEDGARAALQRLAVGIAEPFPSMSPAEIELRAKLRAHASQLGDPRKANGEQEIEHLVSECAYEHWHRMLFARFLAENQLLIHPDHGVPVTLAECEELAAEVSGEDSWSLAARFAAQMLPAIFRPADPVLSVRLAPEHQQPLEKLLAGLPVEVFTADDGLGWVYQFWQSKRKKEVNESGGKIGADELPVVTQLFTEPYMVQFLLHNTLGAWWAGKVLARRPELSVEATSEAELRAACALPGYAWSYLRFIRPEEGRPWSPGAGTFDSWPDQAAKITVLDPCCGSGHFLVEAFRILVSLRRAEEGLSARDACESVLRDNLFGLEIDVRCTQIAVFNLALAAWSHPEAGGFRPLPELHIACSGLSVGAKEEEWLKLAGRDGSLRQGMLRLYYLFKDAPILGSLIDPQQAIEPASPQRMLHEVAFAKLRPLLDEALGREDVRRDARTTEAGIAAQGMARAAALLANVYTLVATNVPFLGYRKMSARLKSYCEHSYRDARHDLANVMIDRLLQLVMANGSIAMVTPQKWFFISSFINFRKQWLTTYRWNNVARLGPGAFNSISGEVVSVALLIATKSLPPAEAIFAGFDCESCRGAAEKAHCLLSSPELLSSQAQQLNHPDQRLLLVKPSGGRLLKDAAISLAGIQNGDSPMYQRRIWELPGPFDRWVPQQTVTNRITYYSGFDTVLDFDKDEGHLRASAQWRREALHDSDQRGKPVWGRCGVLVSRMSNLPCTLYRGDLFDQASAVIIPDEENILPAVWAFCSSTEFKLAVRKIDKKLNVTSATLAKVPFDLAHWREVAKEKYPRGLPEPESADPTQWLFHGRPEASTAPLQVVVARLLGYRWPAELDETIRLSRQANELVQRCGDLLSFADADGIACIPPVRGEQPAEGRLQRLLAQAFGSEWTPATLPSLLEQAEFSGKTLDDWLRDGFFEQHCQFFQQRPFIWHIWDGRRRDGFAALVNYHKLDRKLLERLTYTVLGDWITHQRQGVKAGELGAEDRLAAAETLKKKLALILEGEPPYDIFVRWKPLYAQPIGWDPDLNDGVRMNIRPFVEAGVLRKNPRIKWTKDRGAEPVSLRPKEQFPWFWKDGAFTGERVNDVHLTNAKKRAAPAEGGK